jgi:hypothetical protein
MNVQRLATAALVAVMATTTMASAQSTTLYSGTKINAKMDTTLDSGKAYVGQRFTMHVSAPYPSSALQGAYISGHVVKVVHAKQGVKPELQLGMDRLYLSDGSSFDIDGQMISSQQSKSESNLGHTALTALGGMIAGNMIGKTILHTGGGGAVGLAAGALYGLNAKTNFNLPAGSNVTVQLTHTVTVRRQSHR